MKTYGNVVLPGDGSGPVHGSAPDIAGRGIANPVGSIASVALLPWHGLRLTGLRTANLAARGGPMTTPCDVGVRVAESVTQAVPVT